jgi:hypothetical protein
MKGKPSAEKELVGLGHDTFYKRDFMGRSVGIEILSSKFLHCRSID